MPVALTVNASSLVPYRSGPHILVLIPELVPTQLLAGRCYEYVTLGMLTLILDDYW
jgi:hypothetical protein